jgi:hypothetical protein
MSAQDNYPPDHERVLALHSPTYFSSEVPDTCGVPVEIKENL